MKKLIIAALSAAFICPAAQKEAVRVVKVSDSTSTVVRVVYRDAAGKTNLVSRTFVQGTTNWCDEAQMVSKVKQSAGIID